MKYQAVIFDLDGTAIPNDPSGTPSPGVVEAVHSALGHIKLCAATGRPISNAKEILQVLKLTDPCVISAGTQIIDPITNKVLWEVTIDPKDVKSVLDICLPYDYEILIRNELLGEGGKANRKIDGTVNVMYVMGCHPDDAEVILMELAKIPGISASEVRAWWHDGLDIHITNKEATKEHSIAELLKLINVPREATIGVGDGNNDVHLFKAVGLKVAMGNSTDLLKSQADEVTDSVDNDGLAITIKKYSQNNEVIIT